MSAMKALRDKNADLADLEKILNPTDVKSSVMPRWQRKALQRSDSSTSNDRFIPTRSAIDFDSAGHVMSSSENSSSDESDESREARAAHADRLRSGLLDAESRVLAYKQKAPAPKAGYVNSLKVLYTAHGSTTQRKAKSTRHIPSAPSRVLDAPDLLDDYYLNLTSWGANNCVAVALGPTVYVWNAGTGAITELLTLDEGDDYVCSVSWLPGETGAGHLAVGTSAGSTELWDVAGSRALRRMDGHAARVSCLAWNGHCLSSAGRDATIVHHDVRIRDHATGSCVGHQQEICGLSWSPDGTTLASGANDNCVMLWSAAQTGVRSQAPAHSLTDHTAAVKALAWSPHDRHVLASGGGTADRCIKLWNASSGVNLNSVDTGSQVCALAWNPREKELLSGHGYAENQLSLWKYPSMARVKDLKGHTGRVLALCTSPDGSTVLSAGADETLRFWDCFGTAPAKKGKSRAAALSKGVVCIR